VAWQLSLIQGDWKCHSNLKDREKLEQKMRNNKKLNNWGQATSDYSDDRHKAVDKG
jgi:hypothetical protein